MIQTKFPVTYGDRDEREGIIMLEVRPLESNKESGNEYLVIDWDISKDPPEAWKTKRVNYDNDKMNFVDQYLEANNDFSSMNRVQKEWKKIALALLLDTQTNLLGSGKTIYKLNPSDWELSPE